MSVVEHQLGDGLAPIAYEDLAAININRFPAAGESVADASARLRETLARPGSAVALDIETTALQPADGVIRTIQLGLDDPTQGVDRQQLVIDCFSGIDLEPVHEVLQSRDIGVIVHYARFEQKWLWARYGVKIECLFDTCAGWRLLKKARAHHDPGAWQENHVERGLLGPEGGPDNNTLTRIIEDETGSKLPKEQQTAAWGQHLSDEMVEYAGRDVAVLHPLFRRAVTYANELDVDHSALHREMNVQVTRGIRDAEEILRKSLEEPVHDDVCVDDWPTLVEYARRAVGHDDLEAELRAAASQIRLYDRELVRTMVTRLRRDANAQKRAYVAQHGDTREAFLRSESIRIALSGQLKRLGLETRCSLAELAEQQPAVPEFDLPF